MKALLEVLVATGVIEAVWQQLKLIWPKCLKHLENEKGLPVDQIGVMILAIAACATAGFDLAEAAGLPLEVPFLGPVLTGVLVSRLSALWHDLLGVADGIRQDKKPLKIESGL